MKKPTIHTLDMEEELEYDNTAMLFFHTDSPGYVFVNDLNRLLRLRLSRKADIALHDLHWPFYLYKDNISKLTYLVIERPQDSGRNTGHWKAGHKLLIIKGDGADERAQDIHDLFASQRLAEAGRFHLNEEQQLILEAYQQELTPVSRLTDSVPHSDKAAKEHDRLEVLTLNLLDQLNFLGI